MYIFKNAWKSIVRSKGRNILIGIIVAIIAFSSCIALSIKNSSDQVVENYKNSSDITATLSLDRQAMMKDAQTSGNDIRTALSSVPVLTIDELTKYSGSPNVKSFSYTVQSSLNASNISAFDASATASPTSTSAPVPTATPRPGSASNNPNGGAGGNRGGMKRGDYQVIGYSSALAMTNFINGTYKITSGAMFADGETNHVCVISNELAQYNSIDVGSTITFTNPAVDTQTYDFAVVGIYTNTSTGTNTDPFSDQANNIVTSYVALNNVIDASKAADTSATTAATTTVTAAPTTTATTTAETASTALSAQLTSSFLLNNADSVDGFKADLTAMGLSSYYTVQTNLDSYNTSLTPLKNLGSFAIFFLLLVLGIGGIILVVFNIFNIRERKYEVGVLRTIGMKKGKVVTQFISELFIVTFLAIAIGSAVGAAASVPTANALLASQISAQQTQQQTVSDNFGGPRGGNNAIQRRAAQGGANNFFGRSANISYIDKINAVMNAQVLLQILLIGILLTLISSSVSVIFITRYEPLKILSNRS
jgi:putative ABC transport system permease protein